jgi:hypothetical protein
VSNRGRTTIVTTLGLRTSMSWWFQLRVDDSAVIVAGPSSDDRPWASLVLAQCDTVDDARQLYALITERLRLGAPACDAGRLAASLRSGGLDVVVDMQKGP